MQSRLFKGFINTEQRLSKGWAKAKQKEKSWKVHQGKFSRKVFQEGLSWKVFEWSLSRKVQERFWKNDLRSTSFFIFIALYSNVYNLVWGTSKLFLGYQSNFSLICHYQVISTTPSGDIKAIPRRTAWAKLAVKNRTKQWSFNQDGILIKSGVVLARIW